MTIAEQIVPTNLAAGFSEPTFEDWQALASKSLKGADLDSLTLQTLDGLPIEPLYRAADRVEAPPPSPPVDGPPWDIRVPVARPEADQARSEAAEARAGGATSLLLRIDPEGRDGVTIGSAADLAEVLEGIGLEEAGAALEASFLGPIAAEWLAAAAKASPRAQLSFHLDPLSAFAAAGKSPGPIGAHVDRCASLAPGLIETYPRSRLFLASGSVAHEASGSEALEIAFALAAALAYAKALAVAGVTVSSAFERIVVGLSVEADPLAGAIKLRAARRLWSRIAGACGSAAPAFIEARSSRRMLTAAEPWTNLVRLTAAAAGAAFGGAQAIVLGAFTDPLGWPGARARRLSRNIHHILMEEADLGRVADPLGGSGYVEAATRELAQSAWARFQGIEAAGGLPAALESGLIAREVEANRSELERRLRSGETRLLGVTDFAGDETVGLDVETAAARPRPAPEVGLPGGNSECLALTPVSLEALAA
ncbi:MAG TPA: methylmalonyl-CoA mutase family protein [Caulobacteraceae bacterium]|nr:methylmalonyl-CoA mutase family protein [Caulobacteraceae bacterium]